MKTIHSIEIFRRISFRVLCPVFFSVPWFLIIVGTLVSCSPQRRLERLIDHHPELLMSDTIPFRDTIIRLPVRVDTAFTMTSLIDTVKIVRDRLEVSLIRISDTIRLKAACRADTIIRTLRIPVERIKLIKEPKPLTSIIWILLFLLIGLAIITIIKRA